MENGRIINQSIENEQNLTAELADFSKLFSVKDLKGDNFGSLLVCSSNDEAIRACKIRLLYEQNSLLQQFPADFMLYHVGYFNTKTGLVQSTGVAVPIISLLDVSIQLDNERHSKSVDVPEFMKGDNNADRNQEPSSSECVEVVG